MTSKPSCFTSKDRNVVRSILWGQVKGNHCVFYPYGIDYQVRQTAFQPGSIFLCFPGRIGIPVQTTQIYPNLATRYTNSRTHVPSNAIEFTILNQALAIQPALQADGQVTFIDFEVKVCVWAIFQGWSLENGYLVQANHAIFPAWNYSRGKFHLQAHFLGQIITQRMSNPFYSLSHPTSLVLEPNEKGETLKRKTVCYGQHQTNKGGGPQYHKHGLRKQQPRGQG